MSKMWPNFMNLTFKYFLIQALVFEKSNYDGPCLDISSDVYNLKEKPVDGKGGKEDKKKTLSTVGSIKILGGL